MKSILNEGKFSNSFLNEAIAMGLFTVGFFLLKLSKNFENGIKWANFHSKELFTNSSEKKREKTFNSIEEYNYFIKNILFHNPNLEPFEVINSIENEGFLLNSETFNILMEFCFKEKKNIQIVFQIYEFIKKSYFEF